MKTGCSRKKNCPVITEIDLEFKKITYDYLMLKKFFRKIILKVLTANSCPLKALDMFTYSS